MASTTIEDAEVTGVTALGTVLIVSGSTSYRIEFKAGQIEMLRRLCDLYAVNGDCSTPEDLPEAPSREG